MSCGTVWCGRRRLLLALGSALLASCTAISPAGEQQAPPFRLVFLRPIPNWLSQLGYTRASSWPKLQEAFAREPLIELTADDIALYDAPRQHFLLTASASERLRSAARLKPVTAGKWGAELVGQLSGFVIGAGDRPLLAGITLFRVSAMAIRFPVLYLHQGNDDRVLLVLRPAHMPMDARFTAAEDVDALKWIAEALPRQGPLPQ